MAGFALHARNVKPSQGDHQTCIVVEVLAFENTENGLQETMRTGERETVW
jgi:hypothetical protein